MGRRRSTSMSGPGDIVWKKRARNVPVRLRLFSLSFCAPRRTSCASRANAASCPQSRSSARTLLWQTFLDDALGAYNRDELADFASSNIVVVARVGGCLRLARRFGVHHGTH